MRLSNTVSPLAQIEMSPSPLSPWKTIDTLSRRPGEKRICSPQGGMKSASA